MSSPCRRAMEVPIAVADRILVIERSDRESYPGREHILEPMDFQHDERYGLLRVREVEHPISK